MTERTVREVYTKEVRRRNFDDVNHYIDANINRGRRTLADVAPRYTVDIETARNIQKSMNALHLISENDSRKKYREVVPYQAPYFDARVIMPVVTPQPTQEHVNELRDIRQSVNALHLLVATGIVERKKNEEKKEKKKDKKKEGKEDEKKGEEDGSKTIKETKDDKIDVLVDTAPASVCQEVTSAHVQFDEIIESQRGIQRQLTQQRELLDRMDMNRKDSDRQLREDVTEALRDHKEETDEAIHILARKVSDLLADNDHLKMKVDEISRALEDIYETASEVTVGGVDEHEERKTGQQVLQMTERPLSSSLIDMTDDSSSSTSSGSVAVVLPPAAITEGRRPSQAVLFNATTKTARRLDPNSERYAQDTAERVLAEATRIETTKM